MNIIMCLDKNNGIRFNERRQSRDREVMRDILVTTIEKDVEIKLWMNEYSWELLDEYIQKKELFLDEKKSIIIDGEYMSKASDNDYCFVEKQITISQFNDIKKIIVYRWDKVYPADEYINIDIDKYVLQSKEELKGYAHDLIIKEVYQINSYDKLSY